MVSSGGLLGGSVWSRGLFQRFGVELEAAGRCFGRPTEPTAATSPAATPSPAVIVHNRGERRGNAASTRGGDPSAGRPACCGAGNTPSPSPPPAVARQYSVQLATGVALAQTNPEVGMVMMFSVDYEVQGEPNASGYIWVIERRTGPRRRWK